MFFVCQNFFKFSYFSLDMEGGKLSLALLYSIESPPPYQGKASFSRQPISEIGKLADLYLLKHQYNQIGTKKRLIVKKTQLHTFFFLHLKNIIDCFILNHMINLINKS